MPVKTTPSGPDWGWNLGLAILLIGVFSIFSPVLTSQFTNWDDPRYILENPDLRDFSWNGLVNLFLHPRPGHYCPLVYASFAAEIHWFGLRPEIMHGANLLLHVLNVGLVAILLRMLGGGNVPALLGAALFGLHPLRVESVAWITERKDVLYLFFTLLTLVFYVRETGQREEKWVPKWSLVAFVGACLSKAMAVVVPLLLVLLDWRRQRLSGKSVVGLLPFFAGAVALTLGTLANAAGNIRPEGVLSGFEVLATSCYGLTFYLEKTLAPLDLCLVYPFPTRVNGWLPWRVVMSPALVVAAGILLWAFRKQLSWALFGLGFYVISLLPVLQIVGAGEFIAADRYSYLAAVGLAFLLADGLAVRMTSEARPRGLERLLLGLLVVWLGILSLQTHRQTKVWETSETLFRQVLERRPELPIPYQHLGAYYLSEGDPRRAQEVLEQGLARVPGHPGISYFLGMSCLALQDWAAASIHLENALKADRSVNTLYSLAIARTRLGALDVAERLLNEALVIDPESFIANYNLGILRCEQNRPDDALYSFEKCVTISPHSGEAHAQIALLMQKRGESTLAARHFDAALERAPAVPWITAAAAAFFLEDPSTARPQWEKGSNLVEGLCRQTAFRVPRYRDLLKTAYRKLGREADFDKLMDRLASETGR